MCFRQADVGEYLREVGPQMELRVGFVAYGLIGGHSFHDDLVSSMAKAMDMDMQHDGERASHKAASRRSKGLQMCHPSFKGQGLSTRTGRAKERVSDLQLRIWIGE